ncbi:hypothetical protein [Xanthobacter sp. VNH20]|uniref:hypothetical protein n=1 Tax=Xanthobacter sp. VNH20 TaxID=3156616 RepID=UPI0032B5F9E5
MADGGPANFEAYEQADRLWAAAGQRPECPRDEAAIEALIDSARPRCRLARGIVAGLLLYSQPSVPTG